MKRGDKVLKTGTKNFALTLLRKSGYLWMCRAKNGKVYLYHSSDLKLIENEKSNNKNTSEKSSEKTSEKTSEKITGNNQKNG